MNREELDLQKPQRRTFKAEEIKNVKGAEDSSLTPRPPVSHTRSCYAISVAPWWG